MCMDCGGYKEVSTYDMYDTYDNYDTKNGAIGDMNASKGVYGPKASSVPIDLIAAAKDRSPGQLPDIWQPAKRKPITWTTAAFFAFGAALLLYFLLKIKILKV